MSSLKDEQEWQDRIEQEEHEGCNQDHSPTGLCPCCGVELKEYEEEKWTGEYHNVLVVESYQECPSCSWASGLFYDD